MHGKAFFINVIEIVNFVNARALNSLLFEKLCLLCGAYHRELLFHFETSWLSRSKVLSRVAELKRELETFLLEKILLLTKKFKINNGFCFSIICVI